MDIERYWQKGGLIDQQTGRWMDRVKYWCTYIHIYLSFCMFTRREVKTGILMKKEVGMPQDAYIYIYLSISAWMKIDKNFLHIGGGFILMASLK